MYLCMFLCLHVSWDSLLSVCVYASVCICMCVCMCVSHRTFTDPDMDQDQGVRGQSVMDKALECLAELQGSFAFCIYDSERHRVLAARWVSIRVICVN